MTPLERLAKNSYFTVAPQTPMPACGATRFRWWTHVALPFTLPSRTCVHRKVLLEGQEFDFSIHNHYDRLIRFPDSKATWPSVYLMPRAEPTPAPVPGWRVTREVLQSVACFQDGVEHDTPDKAFEKAGEKVKACFRFLSDHLAALQRSMPYLSSWQIYPISQFDVGLVYHGVQHFCPSKGKWDHLQTGVTINLARQLHQPLCHLDFSDGSGAPTPSDLSNELLAEAQGTLFRGIYRSTVINSYQSVESLANVVFKAKQVANLAASGIPPATAETQAEALRKKHRVDIKFLIHQGLASACGRSLHDEDKDKYDKLCSLNQLRHQVAHAGKKPTEQEAQEAHVLCCEVVQWLCGVGGYPVRSLLPDEKQLASGLVSLPSDINAIPGSGKAFLLWVMGVQPSPDCFVTPCQFGLQVGAPPPH